MKKKYIKPWATMEYFVTETMLATSNNNSEGMGGNETPGGDDDFNAAQNRGEWGTLWK